MDYAANTGQCISYKDLKTMCPEQITAIESHPGFSSWQEVAMEFYDDEGLLDGTVEHLCEAFSDKTIVDGKCLELALVHYEDGSKYDEPNDHDGCVFEVIGTYETTPAGKKFEDIIRNFSFVSFG